MNKKLNKVNKKEMITYSIKNYLELTMFSRQKMIHIFLANIISMNMRKIFLKEIMII